MTENESKYGNIAIIGGGRGSGRTLKAHIDILQELEAYRTIGTVEELKTMKENGAFTGVELAQLAAMQMRLKEYSAIGTIEEFKALKEFKKTITEIVNSQLIAGKNNYKEIYDCFQKIAKAVQDNY